MKKYIAVITLLMNVLCSSSAFAEPLEVDLGQMFRDYKDNEYSFKQKYSNKDLKFTALVSSVDASCYTETPCIKLEHKTYKVAYLHVIPTNIGKALMRDNRDLADLQKKQEITLICRLRLNGELLETDPLVFENCKIDGKEYPIDEQLKAEIANNNINELDIVDRGTCGSNCSYEIDNKGLLLIKPSYADHMAYIDQNAFKNRKDFSKLKIAEGVVFIGDYAFYETNLVNAELPNSLTSIGESAFQKAKLKKIKIPDSVTVIKKYTFAYNALKEIIWSNNLTTIEDYAFFDNRLTVVNIPNTVTSIGQMAFHDYSYISKLRTLKLSKKLERIGARAFGWTKISELNIPDSVIFIDYGAFEEVKLNYLIISDTTEVSDMAFENATIGTVYCRGDVDTCKENLEDAVPETTEFLSLADLKTKQESETQAKAEAEKVAAQAEAEAILDSDLPTQMVDKNILADAKLMKSITVEQLEEYIAQKVDVNARDDKGTTVLMMAALSSSDPQILATLIDNGAELESKRENGWTALTIAARYNSNPEVISVLIDKGATISNGNQLLGLLDKNPRIIRNQAYQELKDRLNDTISQ